MKGLSCHEEGTSRRVPPTARPPRGARRSGRGDLLLKEDGDRIGFFVIGPDADGRFVIQDDGATVLYLAASKADFDAPAKVATFHSLLNAYGATYGDETCELKTPAVEREAIASAALKFVALLQSLENRLSLTGVEGGSSWERAAM